jgi:hypothetical protein
MRFIVAILFVLFLAIAPAMAETVFSDNFDKYNTGTLTGQGNWKTTWGDGLVTSSQAASGPNSVDISNTADMYHQISDGLSSGKWVISVDVYIPTNFPEYGSSQGRSPAYLALWTLLGPLGPEGIWGAYVAFNVNGTLSNSGQTEVSYTCNAWKNLRLEMDLGTGQTTGYYDGKALGTASWPTGYTKHQISAIELYSNGNLSIYFDNISISSASDGPLAVPLPSAAGMGGIALAGGLLTGILRRRRS